MQGAIMKPTPVVHGASDASPDQTRKKMIVINIFLKLFNMTFGDATNMDIALDHAIANGIEMIFRESFDISCRCALVAIAIVKLFLIDVSSCMAC